MNKRLLGIAVVIVPLMLCLLMHAQDQAANVGGAWQLSWQGRRGAQQATLQLKQEGANLSGTFQGPRGSSTVTGVVRGSEISFQVQFEGRRNAVTIAYTGTVAGDKMSGTFEFQGGQRGGGGEQGSQSWTATRQ